MKIPVITVAQMREWEQATWATGQTEAEVIRRVGEAVANTVRRLTTADEHVLILAGKGHNGDDARAAVKFLPNRPVKLLEIFSPDSDLAKLEAALKKNPALIVDGLFGIGLNRPLNDGWKKIIKVINASNIPVLAVDVPSGLNADTGGDFGAVIRASVTLTVGAPKIGMLSARAVPVVGRLEVAAEAGLIPCPISSGLEWITPDDFKKFPPRRNISAHKGDFGHVAIIAGSAGYHGAAVLAARGAQRAQPGLVSVFTSEKTYIPVARQLQAAMVHGWKNKILLPDKTSALLIGPGLAAKAVTAVAKKFTQKIWREATAPVVVDASALDFLKSENFPKNAVRVLTPHPGEAARLLGCANDVIQANRIKSLRDISKKFGGCWVILKGHQTLVGRSSGRIFVNSSGNPQLAQGGSGDLLAGFLAGLLAQPALQTDLEKTLCYAVWQHGVAADELSAKRKNWTVEDLAAVIGNAG
jgi:NAD(P)H-hydrate epimerase